MAGTRKRLGDILVEAGLITRQELLGALEVQKSSGLRLGEVLVTLGLVGEDDVARAVARQLKIAFIPEEELQVDLRVAALIPMSLARLKQVLPVAETGKHLLVAMADPLDLPTLEEVRGITGRSCEPVAVTPLAMHRALAHWQRAAEAVEGHHVPRAGQAEDPVEELLDRAVAEGASEIHLEPGEHGWRLRLRAGGHMEEVPQPAGWPATALATRLKAMAGLDPAERRRPQKGRLVTVAADAMVATWPTRFGERIVVRPLPRRRHPPAVEELGFSHDLLSRLTAEAEARRGLLLVAGPPGSGRRTTLAALLGYMDRPEQNVLAAAEPCSPHIACADLDPLAGFDQVEALRWAMEQSPDVLLAGELHQPEAAEAALRAALGGCRVLAAVASPDAPSALADLATLAPPSLAAAAVTVVLAQRLLRRLCPHCSRPAGAREEQRFAAAGLSLPAGADLRLPQGCPACQERGYMGYVPVAELLVPDAALRDMMRANAPISVMRGAASRQGMTPLLTNALETVAKGLTTTDEVYRLLG